jgi:aminoglycoside phosphotransferase (APT) family kinase protein
MPDQGWEGRLRLAAKAIDWRLRVDGEMQTVIHGDAKGANMLIADDNVVQM